MRFYALLILVVTASACGGQANPDDMKAGRDASPGYCLEDTKTFPVAGDAAVSVDGNCIDLCNELEPAFATSSCPAGMDLPLELAGFCQFVADDAGAVTSVSCTVRSTID